MQLLKFNIGTASLVHKFKDPDTGRIYEADSLQDLYHKIEGYRSQNGLPPIEFLPVVVEHYLCQQRENMGACSPRGRLKRGINAYVKGGIALLKNYMYDAFTTQEVADKRAEQCVSCKFNVVLNKSGLDKAADLVAIKSVGDRRSKFHEKLHTCAACGCPLKSKIFVAGKVDIEREALADMRSVNCWQLKLR